VSSLYRNPVARCFSVFISLFISGLVHAAPSGSALYGQHCASCHGYGGKGGMGVPLALDSFQGSVSDDYLAKTIRFGRPGRVMPEFRHLSDAQIKSIVKHVRSFSSATPLQDSALIVTGNLVRGKRLFAQRCASCHGVNGEGGKGTGVTFSRPRELPIIAPALNNKGFLAAASDSLIKSTLMKGRVGTPMQSFLKQGMTEQDIDDVVSYVRSFEASAVHAAQREAKHGDSSTIVMDSPHDLKTTIEQVKNAALAKNFRIIRVQELEQGLVEKGSENKNEVMVFFCNFETLNNVLAIDPRLGLFLPCRVTVVERAGKVQVMSINPRYLSSLYNNAELDTACDEMYRNYIEIIEEATL